MKIVHRSPIHIITELCNVTGQIQAHTTCQLCRDTVVLLRKFVFAYFLCRHDFKVLYFFLSRIERIRYNCEVLAGSN